MSNNSSNSIISHKNFFNTPIRPDVLREIENRGKKNGTIGLNVGLGPTSNTLIFQKDILKKLIDPVYYTTLMKQIVPLSEMMAKTTTTTMIAAPTKRPLEIEEEEVEVEEEEVEEEVSAVAAAAAAPAAQQQEQQQQPPPPLKRAKSTQGQECPELIFKYISKCKAHYVNEEFEQIPALFTMEPPTSTHSFLKTPTGEVLTHFCEFIKNKL